MVEREKEKNNPPNHDFVQNERQESKTKMIILLCIIYSVEVSQMQLKKQRRKTPICWNQILKVFWLISLINKKAGETDGM